MMAEFQAALGAGVGGGVPHILPPMKKAGFRAPWKEMGGPHQVGRLSGEVGWKAPCLAGSKDGRRSVFKSWLPFD